MEKLTKENYHVAKAFNCTRRFIDDFNIINNDGYLEMYHKNGEIYPKEMQLNKENADQKKAAFLDLEEEINNNIMHVKTYDKQETFRLQIILTSQVIYPGNQITKSTHHKPFAMQGAAVRNKT